jgi:hypothetical protein
MASNRFPVIEVAGVATIIFSVALVAYLLYSVW